ncbi:MAG: bifunctional DNA-formamidopyrimidine glycosylase/DNA-(apurinic or apyrimidinic site) lyase [Myxococcales bacterium]|nr:MAG: bifunctional DNA-formamidopyrimidine glycosylase/DNA-(apurinic or apyrimidinic site) lyase [Myxococcales bacterium]
MPELPEVEITKRQLGPHLVGHRIEKSRFTKASYFFLTPPSTLQRKLQDRVVTRLERLGKYLLLSFETDEQLLLHLGMSGQLFFPGQSSALLDSSKKGRTLNSEEQCRFSADEHTHAQFILSNNKHLVFRDVRKFGKIQWLAPGQSSDRLKKLGPDALSISAKQLWTAAQHRRIALKSFLLDQNVVAGIGNIYADEALFLAKLHPAMPAHSLSKEQAKLLCTKIKRILNEAIEAGGSSLKDFIQPDGKRGNYQTQRLVYGRKAEPCPRCNAPISHIVLGARSSHFCPRCQA